MSASTKVIKVTATERVRQWLRSHPDGGFTHDIATALKLPTNNVSQLLHDMGARGEVTRCKVERPNAPAAFQYRATALLGNLRQSVPWREFSVAPSTTVRRAAPSIVTAHRAPASGGAEKAAPGRLPTLSGGSAPGSAVSALVPPAAAPAAAVQPVAAPAAAVQPVAAPAAADEAPAEPVGSQGEGAPNPAVAMTTEALGTVPVPTPAGPPVWPAQIPAFPEDAAQPNQVWQHGVRVPSEATSAQTREDLRAACDRWLGGNGVALGTTPPLAPTSLDSALALATAEDRAPYGPPAPRFALYSDGTLILENLPHLPPIVAIRPEHSRALVAYLRGEGHA